MSSNTAAIETNSNYLFILFLFSSYATIRKEVKTFTKKIYTQFLLNRKKEKKRTCRHRFSNNIPENSVQSQESPTLVTIFSKL